MATIVTESSATEADDGDNGGNNLYLTSTFTYFDILPVDVLYHMLSFVPVECRGLIEPFFKCSPLAEAFTSQRRVLANRHALGFERFRLPNEALARRPDLLRLIGEYNLQLPFVCANRNHDEIDLFSCNIELAKAIDPNAPGGSLLTQISDLKALDLRGALLTLPLLTLLSESCPKLCCLRLHFASFESPEAYDFFLERLAPRLRHLSLDNLFIDRLELIFHAAVCLEEVQVILYPMPTTTPKVFSAVASKRLSFLSLKLFCTTRHHELSHPPAAFISALRQSPAKDLQHFRQLFLQIKSNYDYLRNYDLLTEIKELSNLLSVNFDLMNFYHLADNDFNFQRCWPKLKSLSSDFYSLRGSNSLLLSFLNGPFHQSLEVLAIHDCRLLKSTMKEVARLCPNLQEITLCDVTVKHLKWLFDWLTQFPQLKLVRIKFTIKMSTLNEPSKRQLETALHFPVEQVSLFRDFLSKTPSLSGVSIADWPGLKKTALNQVLDGLTVMQNICLNFREYLGPLPELVFVALLRGARKIDLHSPPPK
ncbi:hypothetical protein TYRP_005476 [Tyrophagus putrescentiae]|nr:hypothetical protein TYRP_005476 [Tyrophagus putrescentiae]